MSTYVERLELLNVETHSDGLSLQCYPDELWKLETSIGTEYVSTDAADVSPHLLGHAAEIDDSQGTDFYSQLLANTFGDYVEGEEITEATRVFQWVACWTMPGYLDQGNHHTADTEAQVLIELLSYDGTIDCPLGERSIPQWEYDAIHRLAELADNGDTEAISEIESLLSSAV